MLDLIIAAALAQVQAAPRTDPCMAVAPIAASRSCAIWETTGRTEELESSVNAASILRSGDRFEIWDRVVFAQDREEGARIVVMQHRHDCRRRSYQTLHLAIYDARGTLLYEEVPTGAGAAPEPVVAGSPAATVHTRFCPR